MARPAAGADYRATLARAILLGVFTGLFGLGYLIGIELLTELIWPEETTFGWFSGGPAVMVIPLAAGLLVGLVYRLFRLPPRFAGFIDEVQDGEVDPRTAPGAIGVAVLSLAGGASLGPEAPMGTAGGAAGTWLARRGGGDDEDVRQSTFIGISGAFGGLMATPIGGPLLALELEHDQTHGYYFRHLVPGIVAGAVAFGIMWPIIGAPIQELVEIPRDAFESWMLIAAVGLGILAAGAAVLVGKAMVGIVELMRRLDGRPIVRGVLAGAILAAVAYAHPLTLFSGQTTLPIVIEEFEQLGLFVLLALAALKAIALAVSLGGGFYGGPIFPLFFIGAMLGIAVHAVIPAIPLGLAVGSMMAALSAAIALLPVSMAVLAAIMIQSGLEAFAAIVVASATAYAIRYAITQPASGDAQQAASAGSGRSRLAGAERR